MSTQIGGVPATIAVVTPLAEVAITSSTNATPIVVTTAAPHGVLTGDWLFIRNHTVNTAANGRWRAGAVTATTVTLLTDAGASSVGVGVGGATGNARGMAFGATFAIPADADDFTAAAFNVAYEALADRTAYLAGIMGWALHVYPGGAVNFDAGTTTNIDGTATFTGGSSYSSSAVITYQAGSMTVMSGRKTRYRARVALADANATIDVSQGDRFICSAACTPTRIITLDKVGVVPFANECLEVQWIGGGGPVAGVNWSFRRNDGTVVATFNASALTTVISCFAQFEYTGSVWRLGANSGMSWDSAANIGVIPGAGA